MAAYLDAWRKTFQYAGRTGRRDFWIFQIVTAIPAGLGWLLYRIGRGSAKVFADAPSPTLVVLGVSIVLVIGLSSFLPFLAVAVRRLHDSDKSGWWLLLLLIPFGGVALLIMCLLPGSSGPNKYDSAHR